MAEREINCLTHVRSVHFVTSYDSSRPEAIYGVVNVAGDKNRLELDKEITLREIAWPSSHSLNGFSRSLFEDRLYGSLFSEMTYKLSLWQGREGEVYHYHLFFNPKVDRESIPVLEGRVEGSPNNLKSRFFNQVLRATPNFRIAPCDGVLFLTQNEKKKVIEADGRSTLAQEELAKYEEDWKEYGFGLKTSGMITWGMGTPFASMIKVDTTLNIKSYPVDFEAINEAVNKFASVGDPGDLGKIIECSASYSFGET